MYYIMYIVEIFVIYKNWFKFYIFNKGYNWYCLLFDLFLMFFEIYVWIC